MPRYHYDPSTAAPSCPSGWLGVGKRCFKIDATKRNYAASVSYCKSLGAQIASIHSNEENDAISKVITTPTWLGAESDAKGNWKWNDGSKWWQPAAGKHDGLGGIHETKIAYNSGDKKWHDWGKGDSNIAVLCAKTLGGGMF